jgi:hypothetical protein
MEEKKRKTKTEKGKERIGNFEKKSEKQRENDKDDE